MNRSRHTALRRAQWLALLPLGLMAGFFFAFAIDVGPAMAQLDAATYVTTQQAINRVVRNAGFGAAFFGAALLPWTVAALALWAGARRHALGWAAVALAYGVAVVGVTSGINVPINEALAGWNPQQPPPDWQAVRARWNQANAWRAWAALAVFAAAAWLAGQPPGQRRRGQACPARQTDP